MEDYKKKSVVDGDKEIVFSKAIKAGKRIYYLDVKKNRKDEMFLAITESKKIVSGEGDDSQVSFEKHKIFLYKEDFEKFMNGLQQAIQFIAEEQGPIEPHHTENEEQETTEDAHKPLSPNEIKIDIDHMKIDFSLVETEYKSIGLGNNVPLTFTKLIRQKK